MLVDGRFDPTQYTELEIEYAFEAFVGEVRELVAHHYKTQFPNLPPEEITVNEGRTYWKLVKAREGGQAASVYGFVRKADGAILKAANWRAPNVKGPSAIRGYVMQDNAIKAATPYGIIYAR